ncbi:hypothetical protein HKBW3S09_01825, partial [Candidatus Hakubella thermalkaliphila]
MRLIEKLIRKPVYRAGSQPGDGLAVKLGTIA